MHKEPAVWEDHWPRGEGAGHPLLPEADEAVCSDAAFRPHAGVSPPPSSLPTLAAGTTSSLPPAPPLWNFLPRGFSRWHGGLGVSSLLELSSCARPWAGYSSHCREE